MRVSRYPIEVESILHLLSHTKPAVREETVRLLMSLDETTTAQVCLEKLSDPSTSVRKVALEFLWKIQGKKTLPTILRVYLEEGSEQGDLAANYLIQNWEWAQPHLQKASRSSTISIRHRAFRLLYRITGTLILSRAMKDSEETIRLWALRRILSRNHPSTITTLQKLTGDQSAHIRFEAIRGLIRRGQRERLPDLAPFLNDNDYLHQVEATETLFDYSQDQILPLAESILKKDDPYQKRIALDALTTRQIFEATPLALPCLYGDDPRLRRSASRYISQSLSYRASDKIITFLRNRLPELSGERFALTFQLLTTHGDESCRDVILQAIRQGKGTRYHKTLRALCSWLGKDKEEVLLTLLGDNPTLNKAVFRNLKNTDRNQRHRLRSIIDQLLKHRNHEIRADTIAAVLKLTPDKIRERLPDLLKDPAPEVRFEAIIACRKLSPKNAERLIHPLLDDEDPVIRLRAAENILQLTPENSISVQRRLKREECSWVRRKLSSLLQQTNR